MKLLKISLMNFQNIKSLELDFGNGESASIYGENATGKTTVANALSWLLFDKSSTGVKGFNPKTCSENGEMHHLEHGVEGSFLVNDGRIAVLKKVFKEVYKKKRGSLNEEFDGHTVEYFIDGVPVKLSEYNAAVMEYCGGNADRSRLLTNPTYFSEDMSMEDRRKILLEMCGDISDEDVIASDPALEELPVFLLKPGTSDQRYSIDEYKKIASARKKEINKRMVEIPARIDEANHAIPDTVSGITKESIQETVLSLEKQKQQLLKEAATTSIRLTETEAYKSYTDAHNRLLKASSLYEDKRRAELKKIDDEAYDASATMRTLAREQGDLNEDADRLLVLIEKLEKARLRLIQDYKFAQFQIWNEEESICPTCHRTLPEDQIEEKKAEFNLNKSQTLSEINERGKREASREMIAAKKEEYEKVAGRLEEIGREIEKQKTIVDSFAERKRSINSVPFEQTEEYITLKAEVDAAEKKVNELSESNTAKTEEINSRINSIVESIKAQSDLLSQFVVADTQKERITLLEQEEKDLGIEFEQVEKGLYLCDCFVRSKVSALTDKINSRFSSVRFRLFVEQINGGIREDCEVMIPTPEGRMVPYTFANHAARINAGLEIIEAISEHYGISMPVIIDNAEAITKLRKIDTQVIRLVVSEPDKKLRLELAS